MKQLLTTCVLLGCLGCQGPSTTDLDKIKAEQIILTTRVTALEEQSRGQQERLTNLMKTVEDQARSGMEVRQGLNFSNLFLSEWVKLDSNAQTALNTTTAKLQEKAAAAAAKEAAKTPPADAPKEIPLSPVPPGSMSSGPSVSTTPPVHKPQDAPPSAEP